MRVRIHLNVIGNRIVITAEDSKGLVVIRRSLDQVWYGTHYGRGMKPLSNPFLDPSFPTYQECVEYWVKRFREYQPKKKVIKKKRVKE